ncbi:MAG: OB-fold nucleic acid binding domain-containing protein, partial [Patescibacteria group bacterium]
MPQPIEELRQVRSEKLEKLKSLDIDPYPSYWEGFKNRVFNKDLPELELGEVVTVVGRIRAVRGHGGIVFADLYDETGKIQICFREDVLDRPRKTSEVKSPETSEVEELDVRGEESAGLDFEQLSLLDLGDFIGVRGELFETDAGELTV